MEIEVSRRRKIAIIILVLLIHLLLFIGIFFLYQQDKHDAGFIYDQQMQELIDKQMEQPLTPQEQQELDEWVTMKARKSDFGTAVVFAEEPEFKSEPMAMQQQPAAQPHKETKPEDKKETAEKELDKTTLAMQAEMAAPKKAQETQELEDKIMSQLMAQTMTRQSSSQTPTQHQGKRDASPAPQVTLADIAKGFIKQLTDDGPHATAMLGNKTGNPSAEQLKYQRYLQKITWWLNNSDRIHNDRLSNIPATKTSVHVTIILTRDGKLKDIYVRQSCGVAALDEYTMFIFRDASVSFPPVPAYIKEDPFVITYIVNIMIGERAPGFRMSLH